MVEEISEQQLKDMKLHEETVLGEGIFIRRVIGGWIYWRFAPNSNAVAGVFVPENVSSPASVS